MATGPLASDDLAKKFEVERITPYMRFVKDEGLDIISAHYVRNLKTVELKPWARRGGKGVFINHEASQVTNDCYVCEIPPGKALNPQRQLFEEMVLVLSGRGSTRGLNGLASPRGFVATFLPKNQRPPPKPPKQSRKPRLRKLPQQQKLLRQRP